MDELEQVGTRLSGIEDPLGLLKGLFAFAPVGLQVYEADGTCLLVNKAFREIFGCEPPPGYNVLRDEVAERMGLLALIRRAFAGETVQLPRTWYDARQLEHVKAAEGRRVAVESVVFPLFDGPRVRQVAQVFKDVTVETVATDEARLRALFEHGGDVITLHHEDGTIAWATPSLGRLLGGTTNEHVGRRLSELVHPDDSESVEASYRRVLDTPREPRTTRYRLRHADGSWHWMEGTAQNLLREPSVCAVVLHQRDVTQRKAAEEELLRSHKMDAIGRLAGGIAHDFNNMLSAIQGFAGLAQSQLRETDPVRGDIEEVLGAAERAADLTKQLLAFSERQFMQPRVIDASQHVRSMEPLLRRVLEEGAELEMELCEESCIVRVDPCQFEQVMLDLAVNARDAMPDGGTLTIETARVLVPANDPRVRAGIGGRAEIGGGDYVMIALTDTGLGMDEVVKEHIFEPFFTTKEVGRGTGLGLATIFGIVKQSGGHIRVDSELGRGSRFEVYIPCSPDALSPRLAHAIANPPLGGTETILLAEDEPAVRLFVRKALTSEGYDVLEAESGGAALTIAEQHRGPIHLLLTDVMMPRMSGPQLAAQLTSIRPELRVIYMSGYSEDSVIHDRVLGLGTDFIEKPVSAETLAQTVRAVLDRPPLD